MMRNINTNPVLRFQEFKEDWKSVQLKDILKEHKSRNTKKQIDEVFSVAKEKGIINQIEHLGRSYASEDISNYKVVYPNDVVYTKSPTAGFPFGIIKQNKLDRAGVVSVLYAVFKPKNIELGLLLDFYFSSWVNTYNYLVPLVHKGAKNTMNIGNEDFLNGAKISLPTQKEEQKKIADFLIQIDNRIAQLTEKKEHLELYKKGITQKIFSQKLRFKDENDKDFPDWQTKKFEKIFKRVTTKNIENNDNVLTISAQHGLINQQDFFNKSVSANDVTGYYLIKKGDFAYNKSYSKGYPMGAIKPLKKYEKGVVSTLYICFNLIDNSNPDFYEHYFESGKINKQIHKIAQEGARNHGLLNLSVVEFFKDIDILEPHIKEQEKIASFLNEISKQISFISEQLEETRKFKKGLLQNMFI
jgi:type I restriction enzyme S subunit